MRIERVFYMNELIRQGGVIMYPLLIFSIIALAIMLERFLYFSRIRREIPERMMQQLREDLRTGNTGNALSLFEYSRNPIDRVLTKGIKSWGKGYQEMEREMEEMKMLEFPRMEKRLAMLHFIGKMSPSLGL